MTKDQQRLDQQVFHWEEVTRRIGSSLEFLQKANHQFFVSPQASPQYIHDKFSDLQVHIESQLAYAKRQAEVAAEFADAEQVRARS